MSFRHTDSTPYVSWKGKHKSVGEWAAITGIPYGTLRHRQKQGVTGDALFRPVRKMKSPVRGTKPRVETFNPWPHLKPFVTGHAPSG